jgi:hypothetical protein
MNLGSAPIEPPPRDEHGEPSGGPLNGRAEMWMRSREWLEDPAGAAVPDLDSLQADACGPTCTYDSNTRVAPQTAPVQPSCRSQQGCDFVVARVCRLCHG